MRGATPGDPADSVAAARATPSDSLGSTAPQAAGIDAWIEGAWSYEGPPDAGAIAPALARRDLVLLEPAHVEKGLLYLRLHGGGPVAAEVDAIGLIAVDHDSTVTVAPDGDGHAHTLGRLGAPERALDREGADVLALVARADQRSWEAIPRRRDPATASSLTDGIELEFARPIGVKSARLVLDAGPTPWARDVLRDAVRARGSAREAWLHSLAADSVQSRRLRETVRGDSALRVSVWALGGWESQGEVAECGPGAPQETVVPLDLSRTVGRTIRVRLSETPGFWSIDRVAIDTTPESGVLVQGVRPEAARNAAGEDVRGPLIGEDLKTYSLAPGDTVGLRFRVPPASPGRRRTYFIQTTAWERLLEPGSGRPGRDADVLTSGPGALARFSIVRRNELLAAAARRTRARRGAARPGAPSRSNRSDGAGADLP